MSPFFRSVGSTLGTIWVCYGFVVLVFGTIFLVHVLALLWLFLLVRGRRRAVVFRRVCEIVYGLVNPVAYLTIIEPGISTVEPAFWRWLPLQAFAWTLLLATWGLRAAGDSLPQRPLLKRFRLALLWADGIWLSVFAIKDLSLVAVWFLWPFLGAAPLYLIPLILIVEFIRREGEAPDARPSFFLMRAHGARTVAISLLSVAVATLIAASWHPSADDSRRMVLGHRNEIIAAARNNGVDPGVVAAILFVTQREQITPFRQRAEAIAVGAWLEDPTSNFNLAVPFNVSIGLTQIKPVTAQTALLLADRGGYSVDCASKECREVPRLGWHLPDNSSVLDVPLVGTVGKQAVVNSLADDRDNIRFCALILGVYQVQWQNANPPVDISRSPGILATLFQIGFERSHPHPGPRSNEFGVRVQNAFELDWMREAFGSQPAARQMARQSGLP